MLIKCIDTRFIQFNIIPGKVYQATYKAHESDIYRITGIGNYNGWGFPISAFVVVGCPCSIKNCIKHRLSQ